MKAAVLTKFGTADKAFEIKEVDKPKVNKGQVLIKTEAFGLNFADIVARQGDYQECPPLPTVIGYDVVGEVVEIGDDVSNVKIGDRVTAMTRFGGYAEYALTDHRACAKIPADYPAEKATALTTQYCTAYYCFNEITTLHKGDKILIHAAAGGVGTALVQMAVDRGCEIFGTAGSQEKLDYLKSIGVHHPINYRNQDFEAEIKKILGDDDLDVIIDPVGGKSVRKGFRLLASGGRIIMLGVSDMSGSNVFGKIKSLLGFGFYHPVQFMLKSKSMLGVNMLHIGDNRPMVLKRCLENVVALVEKGVLDPKVGKVFPASQLVEAHEYLEGRKSMGKVSITW